MTLAEAEGERAVSIAVAGDDPLDAPTNATIHPPVRAIVVATSTQPEHRTNFHEATVSFTPADGFLVKLPPSVAIAPDVHQFLLLGYEIEFELLH